MNISTSATMNYTQMVGINYISTIAGNASHFITGKLMEMIDGDVVSEVKNERKEYASEVENISQDGSIQQNALGNVFNNSGENSNNY